MAVKMSGSSSEKGKSLGGHKPQPKGHKATAPASTRLKDRMIDKGKKLK
jgi:hypothetical protein